MEEIKFPVYKKGIYSGTVVRFDSLNSGEVVEGDGIRKLSGFYSNTWVDCLDKEVWEDMKINRLTQNHWTRLCFVILVIIFNIYFGMIIFEHRTVEDDIIGRVSGTLLLLIMLQIWLVAVYNILLIVWKWIWKYEV